MAVRQIDGYSISSTAIQTEPGSKFYGPGVVVRKDRSIDGVTYLLPFDGELTEDEAHIRADSYLVTITAVDKDAAPVPGPVK